MQTTLTTKANKWFSLFRGLGVILVAFGLILSGCDSNGSANGGGNGGGGGGGTGDTFSVPHYDTTSVDGGADVITVSDDDEPDEEGNGEFGIGFEDQDGNEVTEVTWSSDFIYKLDGFVFVEDGEELNIEPGTIIKGLPGSGEDASALIVARGGQIFADGNPGSSAPSQADPIIFTADADPVTPDTAPGGGLDRTTRGEWGGVILLGNATINNEPPENSIEGVPTAEGRALYGAETAANLNDEHDIGVFRFVSIRHTGSTLASGSEIQGLSMGGVGNQSTIEYVESYASSDDGYEWFGGTVNTKFLISAWVADDAFDYDEGWQGSNQFWIAVHAADDGGRMAEQDGGTDPETGTPFATAKISNATFIGMGPNSEASAGNNPFLVHRDNNASSYYNSVFMDGRRTDGLQIEDLASGEGEDSRDRWLAGELEHVNNLWWNIGPDWAPDAQNNPTTFETIIQLTTDDSGNPVGDGGEAFRGNLADDLLSKGNELLSQQPIQAIDRADNAVINSFNPTSVGPAADANPEAPSDFGDTGGENAGFTSVSANGAVTPETGKWYAGWTLLSQKGEIQ